MRVQNDNISKHDLLRHLRKELWILILCSYALADTALGRKSNLPYFEDPFDMGAGSASLTRASRDGRLFANPALLPVGGGFHRWLGLRLSLRMSNSICETFQSPCPLQVSSGEKPAEGAEQTDIKVDPFSAASRKPLNIGQSSSFSWVTSNFGFSLLAPFMLNIDLGIKKIGRSGFYELDLEADVYGGMQTGFAIRTPLKWLYIGMAPKAVVNSNPSVSVSLANIDPTNPEALAAETAAAKETLINGLLPKFGIGVDIGALLHFRSNFVDYLIAFKSDDTGDTKLKGLAGINLQRLLGVEENSDTTTLPEEETVTEKEVVTSHTLVFKEVRSVGMGLTFHTRGDQIHLSVDYRDVENVYEEPMFKRVYAGVKVTLRSYIGLATGIAHGYPTYGIELDLILAKLNIASFARERSKSPGLNPRRYYMISFNSGF